MSYDIYTECRCCPRSRRTLTSWGSCTSNLAPMWCAAGADLAEFHDKLVSDCQPALDAAIRVLESDPTRFRAMNPSNGWGSYDDLMPVLRDLAQHFRDARRDCPSPVVMVSR